jgi:hypothetical protein
MKRRPSISAARVDIRAPRRAGRERRFRPSMPRDDAIGCALLSAFHVRPPAPVRHHPVDDRHGAGDDRAGARGGGARLQTT